MRNTVEVRPTLHLVSNIEFEVSEDTLVATDAHVDAVHRLIEIQRQKSAIEKLEAREKDFIRKEMGSKQILMARDGTELATYKRDSDVIKWDRDALALLYPAAFANKKCVWMQEGPMRLCIKK